MADALDRAHDTRACRPEWLAAFLADRGTRKPSPHTLKAYRQDFDAIAALILGDDGKDRRIPVQSPLVEVLERYVDSRAARFPATAKRRCSPGWGLAAWPAAAPLFVGADGERISRDTLQYRVLRAFRRAGIEADRARSVAPT